MSDLPPDVLPGFDRRNTCPTSLREWEMAGQCLRDGHPGLAWEGLTAAIRRIRDVRQDYWEGRTKIDLTALAVEEALLVLSVMRQHFDACTPARP